MSGPGAAVAILPSGTLESDSLAELIEAAGLSATPSSAPVSLLVVIEPRGGLLSLDDLPTDEVSPGVPVLLVVDTVDARTTVLAEALGAVAVVSSQLGTSDLLGAVRAAIAGGRLPSCTVAPPRDVFERLTERERQVIRLVAHGETDELIAEHLGIHVSTVRTHVQHALLKLEVNHRHAAAALSRTSRLASAWPAGPSRDGGR